MWHLTKLKFYMRNMRKNYFELQVTSNHYEGAWVRIGQGSFYAGNLLIN